MIMGKYQDIILAAGKGSRLMPLTKNIPKCLVQVNSKPILEWQLYLFKKNKIPVNIITGYLNTKIVERKYEQNYFLNKEYDTSNMVYSFFKARPLIESCINKQDIIISYGDIIYSPQILTKLINIQDQFSCAVDMNFKKYWKLRMYDIENDLESLSIDNDHNILSIGQKINDLNNVDAQYMGLIKISAKLISSVLEIWDEILNANPLDYSKNLYMTDFLQYCIDKGLKLKALKISHPWAEIDTPSDIKVAEEILNFDQFISF